MASHNYLLTVAALFLCGVTCAADKPIKTLIVDGFSNHNWRLNTAMIFQQNLRLAYGPTSSTENTRKIERANEVFDMDLVREVHRIFAPVFGNIWLNSYIY